MRYAVAALLIALGACSPTPTPSRAPSRSADSSTLASTPGTTPTTEPIPSRITFRFDVESHASVEVVVSVASDTAATMHGFAPGQRGTISIPLLDPANGISVEIQGSECRLLASGLYPRPVPFTLLLEDGPQAGTVQLSSRGGASSTPLPLPSSSLVGCGG
jgi:hypothetical protein